MTTSQGLLHVNLNVSDLERSVRFYREAFGFVAIQAPTSEIVDRGAGPERIDQALLTIPGTRTIFALTQAASLEVGPRGLNHLGLVLTSDQACANLLARVEGLGGSVQKQGVRYGSGVSEAFAYVRDPDGYAIELSTQAILYSQLGGCGDPSRDGS